MKILVHQSGKMILYWAIKKLLSYLFHALKPSQGSQLRVAFVIYADIHLIIYCSSKSNSNTDKQHTVLLLPFKAPTEKIKIDKIESTAEPQLIMRESITMSPGVCLCVQTYVHHH
jgi:hypothetical protein